jgi:hypothetical protein
MFSLLRVLGVSLLVSWASVPAAQEVRIITDEVSCDSCVIERYKIATIHDRDLPEGALVNVGTPHVNADGTFLVIAGSLSDGMFLAESDGSIVRRIGRGGEGPGEYARLSHVDELPGAYLVFDSRLARVTRLSKTTFEVLGTAPSPSLGGGFPPLVFEDGSYLIPGTRQTREGAGHLYHLFDAAGRAVRSFGGRAGGPPPRGSTLPRVLAASRDGTFWVASRQQYRLERWNREGNLLEVYEREADWHPHYPLDEEGRLPSGMRSTIRGLWEDEDGLLWVHGLHMKDGQPVISPPPDIMASVVEVIDPVAGTLVASSRVEGISAHSALGGFHQTVRKEDPETFLINIEVWGARFKVGPEHHEHSRDQ